MYKTVDEALKAHADNEQNFVKVQTTLIEQSKHVQALQKKLERITKPVMEQAKKYEALIQNNTIKMQGVLILKHQLEGAIKQLGGEIPEETKMVLPSLLENEDELLQSVADDSFAESQDVPEEVTPENTSLN